MNRTLAMLIIGLGLGGGVGFVIAAGTNTTLDGHDHGDASGHGKIAAVDPTSGSHDDRHLLPHALPAGGNAPTVTLTVREDAVSGWNLQVETTNFAFAPARASGTHVSGEGHAHVYVDDRKIARLYGNWMHLESLPSGTSTVHVTLNANDHRPLAVDDRVVSDSVEVAVK